MPRFFLFGFSQILCADTPRSGAPPSRVASKTSAPVVSCERTPDPARLQEPQISTHLRPAHFSPPAADPLRIVCWLPLYTWVLFKTTIPEKSRHSSAGAFFAESETSLKPEEKYNTNMANETKVLTCVWRKSFAILMSTLWEA